MTLQVWQLQERLRQHIRARTLRGETSGLELARRTGLQQAHISNFLNRRRGLSLQSMDLLLRALHLDLLDLLDRHDARKYATTDLALTDVERVPVLPIGQLHLPELPEDRHREYVAFTVSFLRTLPARTVARRHSLRFVATRVDEPNARAMRPRLEHGALLLIDRAYNSPRRYRRSQRNIYAVSLGDRTLLRYVEVAHEWMLLWPENRRTDVEVLHIPPGKTSADYIVGRVCHIGIEA